MISGLIAMDNEVSKRNRDQESCAVQLLKAEVLDSCEYDGTGNLPYPIYASRTRMLLRSRST